jgi:AcrR family transcriptional regulator
MTDIPRGNREKLLDAGVELLSRKRFTDVKMEEVASLSGVTKPMVYYYFGSKDGFFTSLVEHMFNIARDTFEGVLPSGISVREALKRFMLTRLRLQRENARYTQAWENLLQESWRMTDMKVSGMRFFHEVFQPVFDQAVKTGEIRPDIKPGLVLAVLASVIEGALEKKHVNTSNTRLMDRLVEDVTDLVFNGIRSREKGDESNG